MNKKLIIVPMRNSSSMIEEVVSQLNAANGISNVDIMILDNHSNDNSAHIARGALEKGECLSGITEVIENATNLGYGGSLKKGMEIGISRGYEWFFILHSDDQADWKLVFEELDNAISHFGCDVVLTSRFHPDASHVGYSKRRIIGNLVFKVITKITIGSRISDPGAAICAFNKQTLGVVPYTEFDDSYHFHPHFNVFLNYSTSLEIIEIPISWKNARSAERFSLISYGLTLLKFLVAFSFSHRILGDSINDALRKAK